MAKSKKPLVIVTRKLPDSVELRMRELFDARLNPDDKPMTAAQLAEAVKTADVLVPTVTDKIDAALLSKAGEQLRLIANFGNGVDNIDVATALQRGITVTNTPGVLTEDTADMTMALILAVPRRLAEGANVLITDQEWNGWSPTWMLGHRIWGKRLGIIGMGRIGLAVARRARAFGLQIHYHNRKRVPSAVEEEVEATYWESLDQMLARMDIVSVNCPHTPATFHLLSARRLVEGASVLTSDKDWAGWTPTWMLGHRIWGKRLGIIGMGRIGQAVARRARAFGLQIHYHNRRRVAPKIEEELDATYWESLDQMLARMDIVSVNCPHTPATYHLLSARRLKMLRPQTYVVNTARGEVIDENALMRMLEKKEIAGAGLDVFEHEPAINPKLLRLDNVVLLPHMGSATIEGRVDMGEKVIINIKTFVDGHRPPDRVLETMF